MERISRRTGKRVEVKPVAKGEPVDMGYKKDCIRAEKATESGNYPEVDGYRVTTEDGKFLATVTGDSLDRDYPVDVVAELDKLNKQVEKLKRKQ